ncbi:DUF4265 domain-containing protein [Microbacterium sp. 22195]|uniref:DUF4265 domain-containing protein n=1 Tax=Microbacterium sp. 22195 TaxID=3453891 RepID=UPI003F876ECA
MRLHGWGYRISDPGGNFSFESIDWTSRVLAVAMEGVGAVNSKRDQFLTHKAAVWRDRSDFVIHAALPDDGALEQLWVRRVSEDEFELCCIPFFIYDVALGDVVQTVAQGGMKYIFDHVVTKSGRYVFRAFFERKQYRYRDSVIGDLVGIGSLFEWSSPSLVAIDVHENAAQEVADYLHRKEQSGHLMYETGKTGLR